MCVCVSAVPLMYFFFPKGQRCVLAIGDAFNTLNLYIQDKSQWSMLDEKFKSVHWVMLIYLIVLFVDYLQSLKVLKIVNYLH